MTNIIYNKFLEKFFEKTIDLELPNTLKIALFKTSYIPNVDGIMTYDELSSVGKECKDCYELYDDNPSKGYKKGGSYITLIKRRDEEAESGKSSYYCNESIYWHNISLYDDNAIGSAVIYRESDGLLICCFQFDIPKEVGQDGEGEDDLELTWEGIDIMSIQTYTPIVIDSELSTTSSNPVQNSTITNTIYDTVSDITGDLNDKVDKLYSSIEKYGIILNGEDTDPVNDPDEDKIDALNRIGDDFINGLFPEDDEEEEEGNG